MNNIANVKLRVINLEEHKYVKCIYNMIFQDLHLMPNKPNWALYVKNLLPVYGIENVWEAQRVQNVTVF